MSGLWNKPGIPHKGWYCVDVYDIRSDGSSPDETEYEACEMCCNERIRFVHVMKHSAYPAKIKVGCVCAEKMSDDYVTPKTRERKLKNRAARRAKWLTRKWRVSSKGNDCLTIDGYNLVVFPDRFKSGLWKYSIDMKFSRRRYRTKNEAKLALFDQYWKLKEEEE